MYENGKIYKLTCGDLVYYGSTCSSLTKRLYEHKQKSNNCTSKQLFEIGDPEITLVEDFACERKEQLTARERFYIENNDCVNKFIPNRTREEYIKTDARKETSKKYYEKNKEHYEEYRENTKEQKAQYDKEYNKNNKEKIQEKRGVKITCECGGKYTHHHKAAHFKTQMHIKNLL